MKITKEMIIQDVLEKCPQSIELFMEYGFHCFSCGASAWETLEEGLKAHGFSEESIERMVEELNEECET